MATVCCRLADSFSRIISSVCLRWSSLGLVCAGWLFLLGVLMAAVLLFTAVFFIIMFSGESDRLVHRWRLRTHPS